MKRMISVKLECACGQRYAFDVEPYKGGMPARVACPACCVDGTSAANAFIAQALAAQPEPVIAILPPPPVVFAPIGAAPPVPPPPPPFAAPARLPIPARPEPPPPKSVPQKQARGKDGWSSDETQINKIGTYIAFGAPLVAALATWMFSLEISTTIICAVVGVCGLIGGVLNILGRGPVVAGAVVGLIISLGAYGACAWWLHDRARVRQYELLIAFVIGALPGIGLQWLLQQILKKRARSAA
ncbi:MAG: hypothetical protein EXS35_14865 [Pedosphaera sp.]|nr:hypothetical protein [Pedosphaera sp.]